MKGLPTSQPRFSRPAVPVTAVTVSTTAGRLRQALGSESCSFVGGRIVGTDIGRRMAMGHCLNFGSSGAFYSKGK